ncbi:MAG: polysaccharide biosynthesis tyrosine autokinase [Planctomycetes bacterium]|nr:polysaccharide biosynthesis tyrosine autokinase [Planctomycetota bacterium]
MSGEIEMNDIQKNEGYQPYQAIQYDAFAEDVQAVSHIKLLFIIARRWRMVIGLSLIISIVIIPFIWLIGRNYFETECAVRVTPIISPILFRDFESDIPMPNYENFVNTQAALMSSNNVLNRVADELNGKGLEFFEGEDNYAIALKLAIKRSKIVVEPVMNTELVSLGMKTPKPRQAEQILNAFIRAYMGVIASDEVRGGDQKLAILEEKRRRMEDQISRQREEIRRLAEEYGTATLGGRYEMMLQQVVSLQNEATTLEIQRMSLEANIKMSEGQVSQQLRPDELLGLRNTFVNSDLTMQTLSADLAEQETLVLELKQVMVADSDRLLQQAAVLTSLKESIKQREREMIEKFNTEFQAAMVMNKQYNLTDLKSQLETNKEYGKRMLDTLQKANHEAIRMGRKQLTINNLQEKLARMKDIANTVNQRIDQLQLERKRPARVTIAYMASSVPAQSMKIRFTVIVIFASICFSSMLILLLEKLDTSLRSPEDLASSAGINIIGTTTSPENIDSAMLTRLLAEDYRTIRANIGLIKPNTSKKIIVVTSPGIGDGKTTFAVNLATSFAKSGKKTLLIDGDLRKPDIAATLNLPGNLRGLQDLLEGAEPQRAVYTMPLTGIDILASDRSNTANALDILARPDTAKTIRSICTHYDHVIIDTPPLLAFTDAMLWAKIADGIILTSFVDRTCSSAFKEAVERIGQIDTTLIGAVVNNVQNNDSYRYSGFGYDCGEEYGIVGWPLKEDKDAALLLATQPQQDTDPKT